MENDKPSNEILSSQSEKDTFLSDYKFLVQKLKTIKERINLLEKIFFNKEI